MRYIMQRKWLTSGQNFYVMNEREEEVYFVDGRVFSVGEPLVIQDLQGGELASIAQRSSDADATFELFYNSSLYASIRKEQFTTVHCRFEVDVPGPDDLEAEGDFWDYEYRLHRNGATVARVTKGWFSLVDTYGIEIEAGEDDILLIASAVVIDLCCHGGEE